MNTELKAAFKTLGKKVIVKEMGLESFGQLTRAHETYMLLIFT